MEEFIFIVFTKDGSRKQEIVHAGSQDLAWETIRLDYPTEYIELF